MTWRLAQSLVVLRDQINAMYPDRDKRTDGVISGYPGAISGHNVNAAGVVCAMDITTGDYPGGITMAQSYPLADAIRNELLVAPRGLYTYLIHHMEPPYVPTPGPYIAHGGPASLWQWIPYTGVDPHTSHIHVSVDEDIPTGGTGSGEDPYDMTDPWNLGGVSAQSGTVTPITEDFLMALSDDEQRRILAAADRINGTIPDRRDAKGKVQTVLLSDDGAYLAAMAKDALTKADGNFIVGQISGVPDAVLNKKVTLKGGATATVASVLTDIQAKPSGTPGSVTVDVQALAAALVPLLPQGPTDLIAELRAQFNK